MADVADNAAGPIRHTITVAKYENGRAPVGPPDATERVQIWTEADGSEVTDPDRIAQLNAGLLALRMIEEGRDGQTE